MSKELEVKFIRANISEDQSERVLFEVFNLILGQRLEESAVEPSKEEDKKDLPPESDRRERVEISKRPSVN